MIDCFRIYLENGLVRQEYTNLAERKFIKETSFDFHEWVMDKDNIVFPTHFKIRKKEFFNKFIEEYPDYKFSKWFSQKRFSQWLDIYGKYKGYKIVSGNDSFDGRWIVYLPEGVTQAEEDLVKKNADPGIIAPVEDIYNNKELDF